LNSFLTPCISAQYSHIPLVNNVPVFLLYKTYLVNAIMTQPDAAALARLSLHNPNNFSVQHAQTLHRLALLRHFHIAPGSKVLELGCGQGDSTTVLADAVGEEGSVVAVDPADLDYGSFPQTLVGLQILSIDTCEKAPHTPSAKHRPISYKAPWVAV
jgi:hypothetical protein